MEWVQNTPDTYTFHLENGLDITVEEYARAKRIELGRDVLGRHRVYLDTKYWVLLRDVFMGRPRRPIHREILDSLSAAVESGQAICPVSYSVYVELLEQRDDKTRSAMAELIDILSLGVCTQPPHELAKSELFRFFCKHTSPASELLEFCQLAWTKVGFIVGDVFLDAELPPDMALAMAKTMDDVLWSASTKNVIDEVPCNSPSLRKDNELLAKELTTGKFQHADEFSSFDEVFSHELAGIVDCFSDIIGEISAHLATKAGVACRPTPEELLLAGRRLGNAVYHAVRLDRVGNELPSIHVLAALHAASRFDLQRRFKAGDSEDFRHATVALAYCNSFFTEKSLKHLLSTAPLDLDRRYNTEVVATEDDVLAHLLARS